MIKDKRYIELMLENVGNVHCYECNHYGLTNDGYCRIYGELLRDAKSLPLRHVACVKAEKKP
jgi:hypothetical protein